LLVIYIPWNVVVRSGWKELIIRVELCFGGQRYRGILIMLRKRGFDEKFEVILGKAA
jgi:hypothetical protein